MQRCPSCNARLNDEWNCHRCGANLGLLMYINRQAEDHYRLAVSAFITGDAKSMLFHAKRACALRQTPERLGLLACAAILSYDFDLGVSIIGRLSEDRTKLRDTTG